MYERPLISFDFAIKYLLRDKGNYDIIEGFISALLATEGYQPVKIKALLESEPNRESSNLKRSIADLVVQDKKDNQYIVEIKRAYTPHFVHKACFNCSRMIVDSIASNQNYTTIKKVFHISLLYFGTQAMEQPLYHVRSIGHVINTADPIAEHPMPIKESHSIDHQSVFPEYFFISVPLFNDVISQEIDEWLYVMKYEDVRDDFHSPYMKKVKERLAILHLQPKDRAAYYTYIKEAIQTQDALTSATHKGFKQGLEKGVKKGAKQGLKKGLEKGIKQVAQALIQEGGSPQMIAKATGLTLEAIAELKASVQSESR